MADNHNTTTMDKWWRIQDECNDTFQEVMSQTYSIAVPQGIRKSDLSVTHTLPSEWDIGPEVHLYGTGESNAEGEPIFNADYKEVDVCLTTDEQRPRDYTALIHYKHEPFRFIRMTIAFIREVPHLELSRCIQVETKVLKWTSQYAITAE